MSDVRLKTVHAWEPWFFLFFGVFHLHRIWARFTLLRLLKKRSVQNGIK